MSSSNPRQLSLALVVISTGIFLLAVLFSMIQGFGFYIALGLLVLGCFVMIGVGILRESSYPRTAKPALAQKVALQDPDDLYA